MNKYENIKLVEPTYAIVLINNNYLDLGLIKGYDELVQKYINQAIQKYCNGDYLFKGTNFSYAKIEIVIQIKDKNGGTQNIATGWEVRPNGYYQIGCSIFRTYILGTLGL